MTSCLFARVWNVVWPSNEVCFLKHFCWILWIADSLHPHPFHQTTKSTVNVSPMTPMIISRAISISNFLSHMKNRIRLSHQVAVYPKHMAPAFMSWIDGRFSFNSQTSFETQQKAVKKIEHILNKVIWQVIHANSGAGFPSVSQIFSQAFTLGSRWGLLYEQ